MKKQKKIIQGKIRKSPFLAEFSDWFMSTYSAKVLNVQFGKSKIARITGYRLYIIMETTEDYQKMFLGRFQFNKEYMTQISNEFRRIALKHHYASEEQFVGMWIRYDDFSVEAKTDANRKALGEAKTLIQKKHRIVWDVLEDASYGSVVFYYPEKDVIENENNGIRKSIADDYYLILKKYDELNFFTRENMHLKFDSKENVDKNFQGNLFYYFK